MDYITAPVIAAIIAAFLGSFFGALFKEQLADLFHRRRRKRELRGTIIKDIVMFYSYNQLQVPIQNMVEVLMSQKIMLQGYLNHSTTSERRTFYVDELMRLVDFLNSEVERDHSLAEKVNELEGSIHASVFEAVQYLNAFRKTKLKTVLKTISEERFPNKMLGQIPFTKDYDKLLEFRDKSLHQMYGQIQSEKNSRKTFIIEDVERYLI